MTETSSLSALPKAQPLTPAPGSASSAAVPEGGFLDTLIDTVNPMQHLPVVSSLYREATGDGISGLARIAGGALFGGIPGLIVSAASTLFDAATGEDPGEMAISALKNAVSPGSGAAFAPDDGSALAADKGEALIQVASAREEAAPPPASLEPAAAEALKIPGGLGAYRDNSFGFKEEGKREQYMSSLDKIALTM